MGITRPVQVTADPVFHLEPAGPERAEELLRSVEAEGTEDPLWHYRLGYSLFYQDREEEALSGEGRVLVRPSGTEPLVRVMVEAKTVQQAEGCAGRLAELVKTLKI